MEKLTKTVKKSRKRLGRGYGSGKGGHTVGRGQKGQKARGKIGVLFEGTKIKKSLLLRLPLRRGKGKFRARPKPIIIKLDYLNVLPADSKVDLDLLIDRGIVGDKDAREAGVKILGNGEIKKRQVVLVPISKSAAKKVEDAGGTVTVNPKSK